MSLYKQTKKYLAASLTLLACGTALAPLSALATGEINKTAVKETTINVNQNIVVVSGRMSLGLANGDSGEYVYVPELGHKLSELNWGINDVYMLGLGGSVSPLSWLKLNADVWFKLNEGQGTMDDYDWFVLDYQYTDWSHHENVDLTKGLIFDINAELTFYQWERSKFFGIAGFKYDNWKWEVHGGDYVYSSYYLYDTVGSFPDDALAITYEQKFYTPYLGIGFSSDLDPTPITFSGRIIGSTLVSADSKDQHHMRDLVGEDEFESGKMVAFDLAGAYNFTKNFSIQLSYHFQRYYEIKDDGHRLDLTTGELTTYKGAVDGLDHRSDMFALTGVVNF